MSDVFLMAPLVTHAMIAAGVGWVLLRAVRWIHRLSAPVGRIVAASLIVRALLGLTFFWVSYLNLPVLRSLHSGDGFWFLAKDARSYYGYATFALDHGFRGVDSGGASPFFVKALAAWMNVVGVSPAAGLYLNLCLYIGVVVLIVWAFAPANDWRRDLPCISGTAAFSFSPVSIIDSTQSLKDDMFTALITAMCVGAWLLLGALIYDDRAMTRRSRTVLGGGMLCGAIFCIAGIRGYYAVISCAALAVVLAVFAVRQAPRRLTRYAMGSVLVLTGAWWAYAAGAGPYYRGPIFADVLRAVGWTGSAPQSATRPDFPSRLVGSLDEARTGFVLTGGATNIKMREWDEPSGASVEGAGATNIKVRGRDEPPVGGVTGLGASITRSVRYRAKLVTLGLAVVFTPISALKALSIVEFTGGRGLLPLADLDTVFLDLSMLSVLTLLSTRRRSVGDRLPFIVFGITLSLVTAALLGYVVTNYGTLFRLRLIVAAPIWTLALALSHINGVSERPPADTL